MSSPNPEELIRSFCAAWSTGGLDEIIEYFTDDAVYHNIPVDPAKGKEAIRATIEGFMGGVEKVEFKVSNLASKGPVVMTERVDVFHIPGRTIELPVMGTFEVKGDKVAAWRDYFDLNQFMSQLASAE